ncbi:hypothetical protein niasHS_002147 [Heterodera schachtii]|uniref:Protein-tyrosine-phosphatase n=1 Tax=Heterodera schachtii TaxID=97005 RepID=A0ABD2KME2_HETSC
MSLSFSSSSNFSPSSPRPPCLFAICEVRPHLYIAGYASVEEAKLRSLGITHCVDATNIPKTKRVPFCEYLCVPIDDSLAANANRHFQDTADFVAQAQQKGGKTLIYCAAGVSRAATLTIMALVINEGFTLRDAYYRVLESRPIIAPNLGFWRQMIAWEAERNGGRATVALLKGMRTPVPDVYLHKSEHSPHFEQQRSK